MEEGIIKVTPDIEKAKSIVKMVDTTLQLISTVDEAKFPSNLVKEYYDVIRELASVVLLLDGFKTKGEGAHKKLIEYIERNYNEFEEHETVLMDDLRITRNKIAYDGFSVRYEYLERNKAAINGLITKMKAVIGEKLKTA